MPFANSIDAYPDVRDTFDKALASAKGLRITFDTKQEATVNRGRMNAYRIRLRKENGRTYPADHHLHNSTPYEGLVIRQRENVVIVEKLDMANFNIEEIK